MKKQLTVTVDGKTLGTKNTKVAYTHAVVMSGGVLSWHKSHKGAVKAAENMRSYQEDMVAFLEGRTSRNRYSANLCGTPTEERAAGASIKVYAID